MAREIFARSVPAQPDRLGRGLHGIHDGIEQVQAVGMPMRKHCEARMGERRLLPGDRIHRNGRIFDDPLAILSGYLAVLFEPVGL
jgi:hypothetical protein